MKFSTHLPHDALLCRPCGRPPQFSAPLPLPPLNSLNLPLYRNNQLATGLDNAKCSRRLVWGIFTPSSERNCEDTRAAYKVYIQYTYSEREREIPFSQEFSLCIDQEFFRVKTEKNRGSCSKINENIRFSIESKHIIVLGTWPKGDQSSFSQLQFQAMST